MEDDPRKRRDLRKAFGVPGPKRIQVKSKKKRERTGKPCRRCKGTRYWVEMEREVVRLRNEERIERDVLHFWCVNCLSEGHLFGYAVTLRKVEEEE